MAGETKGLETENRGAPQNSGRGARAYEAEAHRGPELVHSAEAHRPRSTGSRRVNLSFTRPPGYRTTAGRRTSWPGRREASVMDRPQASNRRAAGRVTPIQSKSDGPRASALEAARTERTKPRQPARGTRKPVQLELRCTRELDFGLRAGRRNRDGRGGIR